MDLPVRSKPTNSEMFTFGSKELKDQFLFEPGWLNMNHGSFGAIPKHIKEAFRFYQDECEARPDSFIRYEYPKLLDEARAAVAEIIHAPVDSVVFLSNATVGINTILKNLKWNPDGKDVILSFSTVYTGVGKTVDYITDYHDDLVSSKEIGLTYPIEDADVVQKFRDAVKEVEAEGKRVRASIIDVVSSLPGVVFPWEELVKVCKDLGILSVVDGAQAVGQVQLDLSAADPDFFVSNCHKWLHSPRGGAVFYVPTRNQDLLPSALATSQGYVSRKVVRTSPLPPSSKTPFVKTFEFVGTLDNTPYLCVKDAIEWRRTALGGEEKILTYLRDLSRRGSKLIAERLGTEVMDNSTGTLTECAMANVALPIWSQKEGPGAKDADVVLSADELPKAFQWILETMVKEYRTFIALVIHDGRIWARVSAQVYLDIEDYGRAAEILEALCARVAKKEFV
ncbi:related to isopenicillin N epimerase [Cephalotrichum gorgonifer]|uniref:Related to isopenicillin N epimerase n=1 Tax=Cephalotrichum gorgonifer TaxID=2041049 RepID=A0AAE8N7V1_9PEZI|nr:related to isopenicillin N epimerase [Cephalotrichum gorgonifer]